MLYAIYRKYFEETKDSLYTCVPTINFGVSKDYSLGLFVYRDERFLDSLVEEPTKVNGWEVLEHYGQLIEIVSDAQLPLYFEYITTVKWYNEDRAVFQSFPCAPKWTTVITYFE